VALIGKGQISGRMAKEIFLKMLASGESPRVILEREGLRQISDAGALGQIVDQVLAANLKQVEQYRAGKTTVLGFLASQVMKATRGQANPGGVKQALRELRGRLPGLEAGVVARCWVGAVYEAIHHWLELPADQRLPARALAAAVAQFNLRGIGAPPFRAKTPS